MSPYHEGGSRLIIVILAVLYILFPFDLIPDAIPIIGWVDDFIVAMGAGAMALSRRN